MLEPFETVVGLEVHAQLQTRSKLFCACANAFGRPPNSLTCPVCLGLPGALPVLNAEAVALALRAALALGCNINLTSQWARKNYFYPDLPKGYQISQDTHPIATGGRVQVDADGLSTSVRLTRVHMEEDAGKNVHDDLIAGQRSYVDFNRGGTPLIEIVSEPDLRSAAEAAAYLKTLRQILRYLEVCDGNMEEGSLRCDANVSLRPRGSEGLGQRVELKNINSFRFVAQAIDYEAERQAAVLAAGGRVGQETRLWDSQAKATRSMRSKEDAHDYRYFPEPDLPDLILSAESVAAARASLPELPAARRQRYVDELGLTPYDARVLTDDADVSRFFEAALAAHANAKAVANWTINELLRELKGQPLAGLSCTGAQLGELVALVDDGTLSGKMAKEVFARMLADGTGPRAQVEALGLKQVSDAAALVPAVEAALAAHPDSVAKYRGGKKNVLGFLVGQVMQRTGGRANPKQVNALLRERLDA